MSPTVLRERVDAMIADAMTAANADLSQALALVRERPEIPPRVWLDALALQFGPEALDLTPSGEAAERLVVEAYRRFLALADAPAGRGRSSGKYRADPDFNRECFLAQFGDHLIGRALVTPRPAGASAEAKDWNNAERKLTRWSKKHSISQ
jgi:hypothetical protein